MQTCLLMDLFILARGRLLKRYQATIVARSFFTLLNLANN